jgi:hypothetical protein
MRLLKGTHKSSSKSFFILVFFRPLSVRLVVAVSLVDLTVGVCSVGWFIDQSPASHRGGPGLLLGCSMWNIGGQNDTGMSSSPSSSAFPSKNNFTVALHIRNPLKPGGNYGQMH